MSKEIISVKEFEFSKYTRNSNKTFFKKLSLSFSFVIVLMPIFGMLMVTAGIINLNSQNSIVAKIFTNIGNLLFSNLGLWFALAIVIGFANNKAVAVYGTMFYYLIFTIVISSLIRPNELKTEFNILFWKNLSIDMYTTKTFSFLTFNSGVFGGLLCGTIMILIYNNLKNIKLPRGLEFFAGERFVLVVIPFFSIIMAFMFICIWPILGNGLIALGTGVANSPKGLDVFLFRTLQRVLTPFGTGMLLQAPIWYTNVGGSIAGSELQLLAIYLQRLSDANQILNFTQEKYEQILNWNFINLTNLLEEVRNSTSGVLFEYKDEIESWIMGVQNSEIFDAVGDQILALRALNTRGGLLIQDLWNINIRASRFIAPGFSNSMFVLPTLSILMYNRLPKESRREHVGMFINATLTTMLLGVTEPIEFLFCYTSPMLFFFVYAPINGMTGIMTSFLDIKIGTSFSTGMLDFIFSGIVPWISGNDTRFYFVPIVGVSSAFLMGIVAYFWFKKTAFSPTKNGMPKEIRIKSDSYDLVSWFGGRKNISTFKLNGNELNVSLKNEINLIGHKKWFDNANLNEKDFKFKVATSKTEIIKIVEVSLDANQKIYEYKKNNPILFKKSLKEYRFVKKEKRKEKYFSLFKSNNKIEKKSKN